MTYGYKDIEGDRLTIANYGERLCVTAVQVDRQTSAYIELADAPSVAAELLKAAGHDGLADLIGWESAEKKLQERRDAVAASLGMPYYIRLVATAQRAIDYIIALEDGK